MTTLEGVDEAQCYKTEVGHFYFRPVLCLPTGDSPAIAVRFCPQLFSLRKKNPDAHSLFR